jgi:hypothetical protein
MPGLLLERFWSDQQLCLRLDAVGLAVVDTEVDPIELADRIDAADFTLEHWMRHAAERVDRECHRLGHGMHCQVANDLSRLVTVEFDRARVSGIGCSDAISVETSTVPVFTVRSSVTVPLDLSNLPRQTDRPPRAAQERRLGIPAKYSTPTCTGSRSLESRASGGITACVREIRSDSLERRSVLWQRRRFMSRVPQDLNNRECEDSHSDPFVPREVFELRGSEARNVGHHSATRESGDNRKRDQPVQRHRCAQ